jgi:hypothetical protein
VEAILAGWGKGGEHEGGDAGKGAPPLSLCVALYL